MPSPRASGTRRTRGSWTPRIAGIGAVLVLAVGGAIAYSVASPARASRPPEHLPTRVQSVQTVGIIGLLPGEAGDATALRQLAVAPGRLQFGPLPPADQGDPQWTADTIVGGTYVFIYAPAGKCLTSAGSPRRPTLSLQRCDLGTRQRWQRVSGAAVQSDGHEFDQYRDLGSRRCLTMGTGAPGPPAALTACGNALLSRQLFSFYWAA
jgi:hypothetical protein